MFIGLSFHTLSPTTFASGTVSGNIHSVKAYPFPGTLPLSTLLAPPSDQLSTPPSSCTSFFPGPRLLPLPEYSTTMPPPGLVAYSHYWNQLGVVVPASQSTLSTSSTSDSEGPNTDTSTAKGTSPPPSSASRSNSNVSAFTPSRLTTSRTMSTSSSAMSSLPSSLFTDPIFTSGLTSIPASASTFQSPATSATDTFSSPGSASSFPTTYFASSPFLPSSASTAPSATMGTQSPAAPSETTTIVLSTTIVTSVGLPSSAPLNSVLTSTYTVISMLPGQGGTVTDFVTSSSVLSTEPPGNAVTSTVHLSPGTLAAIALGIVGAFAFSALWLFCARRRHRLVREATSILPETHAPGPLDDEVLYADELGYGAGSTHGVAASIGRAGLVTQERYAGILAALQSTERFGGGNEGGSTGGIYGSHHESATGTDWDDNFARASSPTLPLPPDDPPYAIPLSPPPPISQPSYHHQTQLVPPPTAYHMSSHGKSSPGPDAAAWLGGYSVAPSSTSHYARSQTLGSGSGSGSVDALTRTRTGSEEPLLDIAKATPDLPGVSAPGGLSPITVTDTGGNKVGLGSAFGSPAGSMYSPSGMYLSLQHDSSVSYDTRTVSGSGSYGHTRSNTPSSFDVLRSVSSQGALSSAYSHGHSQGFRFGFSRQGSSSSTSTGKKAMNKQHSFGVPPTSFRARKDRGSAASDKEKQGEKASMREEWKRRSSTSASTSGSADEKLGRGNSVIGVRAFLGRLRRAGHTPSPHSSIKDLPSPTQASMDVDPEKAVVDRVTPPPIQIEAATPQRERRRYSFILSNPDPHPPSPYSGVGVAVQSDVSPHQLPTIQPEVQSVEHRSPKPAPFSAGGLQPSTPFPTGYALVSTPSPVPTEESRLAEGLLHPRLRTQGHSDASLRDFEDYSRPIGGVVKNRLYSTTTFGTQDENEARCPSRLTLTHDAVLIGNEEGDVFGVSTLGDIPQDGSSVDEDLSSPATVRHSPIGQ